jgi:hypothetical protein
MDVLVTKTRIIGTTFDVYEAWEPATLGSHGTSTTMGGAQRYGRVGTETFLPPELLVLAIGSSQRIEAVRLWHLSNECRAYAYIIAAHHETLNAPRSDGKITVTARA